MGLALKQKLTSHILWGAVASLCLILTTVQLSGCTPPDPPLKAFAPDYGFPDDFDEGLPTAPRSGGESSGGIGAPDLDAPDEAWPIIRGYWLVDHRTTLRSELPVLLEEVETTIDAILLAEISQEGGALWIHYEMCDVRMENTPAYNHTLLPDRFLTALPYRTRRGRLESVPEGWRLTVPKQYELRGVAMESPSTDPFPADESDLRIYDQDRDGSPGLTAQLVGFPEGEVNLIQRSWDEWSGAITLNDQGRVVSEVSGDLQWGDEQKIIRATNEVLLVEVKRWIPDDPSLHQFTMRRVDQLVCPPRREPPTPDI